ncbi:MAG: M48 family metalloprotease [Rhodospirillales bacterium]|nr:M48 family metalloprotease [Rhodospirillales bacterium]
MPELTVIIFAGAFLSLLIQGWVFYREIRFQRQNSSPKAASLTKTRLFLRGTIAFVDVALLSLLVFISLGSVGQNFLFLIAIILIRAGAHRLLNARQQFGPEKEYGRSVITLNLFLKDTFTQGVLLLLVALPLTYFSMISLTSFGHEGWALVAALWIGFTFLHTRFYPTVIAPLFNQFSPLDDNQLQVEISQRAEKAGCHLQALQIMDGSKRSANGNARVEGLGGAKRVVLLDTLFDILEKSEIIAVIAHELGHIKQHHIAKYELLLALIRFTWVFTIGYFVLTGVAPAIALSILWLVSSLYMFFLTPWISALIRGYEHQADAFVVSNGDGKALLSALAKLNVQNLATLRSDPVYRFFFHSHPDYQEREAHILGTTPHATS